MKPDGRCWKVGNRETGRSKIHRLQFMYTGKAAKTAYSVSFRFLWARLRFGVAGHPQRQRFERIWRKLITARGDLLRVSQHTSTDFIFLKRSERPVGTQLNSAPQTRQCWSSKVKQTVFGKRHACNTQLFFRFAAGRFSSCSSQLWTTRHLR